MSQEQHTHKAVVIGGGCAGLSQAAELSKAGWDVTLLEKNAVTGGRARLWESGGFRFDMGPSWYLMPEVFDRFFERMGRRREDYYRLEELETYYKVFFEKHPAVEITSRFEDTLKTFTSFESRGAEKLQKYLKQAAYKYDAALDQFLYKDYRSIFQFFNWRMMTEGLKLNLFKSIDAFVARQFDSVQARQILEYAMVFLGTAPKDAPALYSLMSHVDLNLGVWYPRGGLAEAAQGIRRTAEELGAEIRVGEPVRQIRVERGRASGVETDRGFYPADAVIAACDYHHAESALLEDSSRSYSAKYWDKRVVAPSMFLMYLGMDRQLDLAHHNLYFADDWTAHFNTVCESPSWPEDPCFYLSCNSKTDPSSAPEGKENVFLLVPTAPGLEDTDAVREEYAGKLLRHAEKVTGEDLHRGVEVQRIFTQRDFEGDYNALKGTALGLAHNVGQTAVFRPARRSKRVKGLYFNGQYTHPGIGVPMTLISSEVTAGEIARDYPSR